MVETIERRRDVLYAAVGSALSAWNALEWELCILFACCVANDIGNSEATKGFWAIVSFDAKLKMANAAVRERFTRHPHYLPCWNKVHNRLIAQVKKRNKIAHATVMTFSWTDAVGPQEDVALAPYFYSFRGMPKPDLTKKVRWHDPRPLDRMYVTEIKRCEIAFRATDTRMTKLRTDFQNEVILPKYRAPEVE